MTDLAAYLSRVAAIGEVDHEEAHRGTEESRKRDQLSERLYERAGHHLNEFIVEHTLQAEAMDLDPDEQCEVYSPDLRCTFIFTVVSDP